MPEMRLDRDRKEFARKTLKVGVLGGKLREKRFRWLGHVARKNDHYVGQRIRRILAEAMRGRPTRRWADYVIKDMKVANVANQDALGQGKVERRDPHRPPQVGSEKSQKKRAVHPSFQPTSLNHLAAILEDKDARTAKTQNNSSVGRTTNKLF